MPSKFDKYVGKYPAFEEQPKYQEKVNAQKDAIRGQHGQRPSTAILAKLYATQKVEKEKIEADLSALNLNLEAVKQMMVDAFQEDEIQSVTIDGILNSSGELVTPRLSKYPRPFVSVTDKEALRRWCIENGLENEMSLHSSTLASIVNERMEGNLAEPDGVKVSMGVRIEVSGLK